MKMNIVENIVSRVLKSFFPSFQKQEEMSAERMPEEIITKELDSLWGLQKKKEEGLCSETECREAITESFKKMQDHFSKEELNSNHIWPKYVKIAIYTVEEPIFELLQYVKEDNYIVLTKRFSDLSTSIYREGEEWMKSHADCFGKALYQHILEEINPEDVPSGLALGRYFQKRGEYDMARSYFEKVVETGTAFNGITSMLACYEEEIKALLAQSKQKTIPLEGLKEQVNDIRNKQYEIYETWSGRMEAQLQNASIVTEQYKREYVALLSGYARFEKKRGNYSEAFALLQKVPEDFPDIHRIYTEEAMLYQFKSYSNPFYNLEKAIETFKQAETYIKENQGFSALNAKSKKTILMPLANSYFKLGRYKEADEVCDQVLRIDKKEYRAIALKSKIASQMDYYENWHNKVAEAF